MEPNDQWRAEVDNFRKLETGDVAGLVDWWTDVRRRFGGPIELVECPTNEPVLHRAVELIDAGFVPPNEMLLVIAACYHEYLKGRGSITLEAAMLGRTKQRAGTVAAKVARRDMRLDITFGVAFFEAKQRGESDAAAAASAQMTCERDIGYSPDSEAWLKARRRKRADK